jgi:Flp pilus assembly protein TadG
MPLADIMTAFRRQTSRFLRSDYGNLTMIGAIAAIPIIGAAGMAVDYARISRVKEKMQLVTDGATLAAAGARNITGTTEERKTKRATIAKNYLTQGLATLTDIDVVDAPVVVATSTNVSISVKATVKGSFMNVFNAISDSDAEVEEGNGGDEAGSNAGKKYNIRVNSQAGWKDGASLLCILALNETSSKSLEIQGTADIIAPGCAVWVNSNSSSGLYENGNATLTAKKICVRGYYNGTNYFPDLPKSGTTDCPIYPDPLAAKFATDYASAWAAATNRPGHTSPKGGTETLLPGKYVGGMTINNGGRITLSPGVYFIVDGTLNIKAGGEVFANGGVTIVITKTNVSSPITDTGSKLTVQAKGNLSIKAPASGPFAGIAIAQHPNVIAGTTKVNGNNVQGGGVVNITGIVYYPKQILYITGAGLGTVSNPENIATDTPQFAIVADRVIIEGNGQLRVGGQSDAEAAGLPALPSAGTGKTTISLK